MGKTGYTLGTIFVLGIFILDTTSDICTGVELLLNDHYEWGSWVLILVFLPNLAAVVAEILRGILYSGICGEACTNWIPMIFYHVYSVIMIGGSQCQPRWKKKAEYLGWIQGFTQSGPQALLQSIVILKGSLIHSLAEVVHHFLTGNTNIDYIYDKSYTWFWGLIQIYSLSLSLLTFLLSLLHFNEWEKRRIALHRLLIVFPYFLTTSLSRLVSLSFIFCLLGSWGLFPLLTLSLTQSLTLISLGLDPQRSILYGFLGFLAPLGYGRSRDPKNQPLGLSLLHVRNPFPETGL